MCFKTLFIVVLMIYIKTKIKSLIRQINWQKRYVFIDIGYKIFFAG